ncbi:MAG TPA: type II toxin-antitoxin system VapC family toxin [Stellaceae bacterium]|jgi:tRNA(fMet)-specific endonuclease VapC|nr:type II toxin-antitoxin system VapC family toxin [Stellaceae bacterium]
MRYLLDTNIISGLIHSPSGAVEQRIQQFGEPSICTSIVVAAELRFGAAKRGSPKFSARVEAALGMIAVLPFDAPADVIYGSIRARLEKAGTSIGANDLLIAAHAMALGCTLVTDNQREFGRIADLRCENWLR